MRNQIETTGAPVRVGCIALFLLVGALNGCADDPPIYESIVVVDVGVPTTSDCSLTKASRASNDRRVVLSQVSDFPCRIVARRTGVVLRPSPDASRPDPSWTSVVRDSRGRIYTAATYATGKGTVLAWNSDGTFSRTIGQPGEGPGELSDRGLLAVFIGPGDSLFVRDGLRWSVFGPDHAFARAFLLSQIQASPRFIHVTSGGMLLVTSPPRGNNRTGPFYIADSEGRWIRSFGSAHSGLASDSGSGAGPRASAYVGGRSFWVAPPSGAPNGYVLEEWTLEGELIRTIERRVPWIIPGETASQHLVPHFTALHIDESGYLWVMMIVKDSRWRPLRRGEDADAMRSELYDLRYEVLDPTGARVLVSGTIDQFPDENERNVPPIGLFFPGSSTSYRPIPDSLGFQPIELLDLNLIQKR